MNEAKLKEKALYLGFFFVLTYLIYYKVVSSAWFYHEDWFMMVYGQEYSYEGVRVIFSLFFKAMFALFKYDYQIWAVVNLSFHALNAYLLWFITLQLFRDKNISLITALLFLSNCIIYEGVGWICVGRSMALFFLLLQSVFLMGYFSKGKTSYLFVSTLLLIVSWMIREEIIFFLMVEGIILFYTYWKERRRKYFVFATITSFLFVLFLLLTKYLAVPSVDEIIREPDIYGPSKFILINIMKMSLKNLIYPFYYFMVDYKIIYKMIFIVFLLMLYLISLLKSLKTRNIA